MRLSVDFETRSRADLRKVGLYRYAADPSTDLWCMAFAFEDREPQLWVPGQEPPLNVVLHVRRGAEMRAWNAQFERIIWREILGPRYGFPVPTLEQWVDTAAEAAAMALPRGLEDAALVLGLPVQKDAEGHRIMLQLCRPRVPTKRNPKEWWDTPEKLARLYEYCKQDVKVERAVSKKLQRLSEREQGIYHLDQRINDRGVYVDRALVLAALDAANEAKAQADEYLFCLTEGAVSKVTKVADMTSWMQRRGVEVGDLRKHTVRDLLEAPDELGDVERQVMEVRQEAGKSSLGKLKKFIDTVSEDNRLRGTMLYHGAATGRWSGKGVQVQNFPRPTVENVEQYVPAVLAHDYQALGAEHPALHVLASLLRSCITAAPGNTLYAGDYANIEARVLAWIAGQDDLVEAFANGEKIYEGMASRIYGIPVEEITKGSRERQIGKSTVLGAGYQMGWETHQQRVAEQEGIRMADEEAKRAIYGFRELYARIPEFWYAAERAVFKAVQHPGLTTVVGRNDSIKFLHTGKWLWCQLPSGRFLAYAEPEIKERDTKWGKKTGVQAKGVNSVTHKWGVSHLYGGFVTENCVQAMSRDVLASGMLRLEKAGYPVVMTVHDEIVSEVPESFGSVEEFTKLMTVRPRWAAGLPVAAEAWRGERYRK